MAATSTHSPRGTNPAVAFLDLVAVLAVITLLACIVARLTARRNLTPLVLPNIRGLPADALVADYVTSLFDIRYAIPSGIFAIDTEHSKPGALRFNERVLWTPGFITFLKSTRDRARADRNVAHLVFLLSIPLLFVAFCVMFALIPELLMKWLLRSTIQAEIIPSPTNPTSTEVSFRLHGISALGLRKSLNAAFAQPELPTSLAHLGVDTA